MTKNKYESAIIILALIMLLAYNNSYAQITLQVGGGAGLTIPESDFSGTTMDYYSGKSYGLGSGLNLHAKAKVGLLGFLLYGQIDYISLSNNGYAIPGEGNVDISQNIVSFKVGPEFDLNIPLVPVTPYLDGNIALNFFSGNVTFKGVPNITDANYVIESASRVGIGLGGGVIFKLNPLMHLDLGIHYNLLNLLGKKFNDVNPTVNQRLDSYLALNDDTDPAYSLGLPYHIIGNSRSINTLQITATLLIGI